MTTVDATHAPDLRSWIDSANDPATDYPIQNLPLGVYRRDGGAPTIGAAIGAAIADVGALARDGLLVSIPPDVRDACTGHTLNRLMALGRSGARALRAALSDALRADTAAGTAAKSRRDDVLVPMGEAQMQLPADIGDYTDFYASVHHATNIGSMLRPDNPLLPNYKYVPIGYHGRASSIVVSDSTVRRPSGQVKSDEDPEPTFGPTRRLDYELEVGVYVGEGNALGESIPLREAEHRLFGVCLVNDWSARDVQAWEYQPLGPFLAKNFATTVSPWVVTLDALAPFRAPAFSRPSGDPEPLPYLRDTENERAGGIDIQLEVSLRSERMRQSGAEPMRVSAVRFTEMYWTLAQMVAHHASGGCNLRSGDLIASGTVSGATRDSRGCLLELTWRGSDPLALPTGEQRRFLEDGDEVVFRGFCERPGFRRIGVGECRGVVTPAAPVSGP